MPGRLLTASSYRLRMAALLCLALAACVSAPKGSLRLGVPTHDPRFLTDIGDAGLPAHDSSARLFVPDAARFSPPHPAIVMLHSSYGQGAQDWHYAAIFRDWGYAVLAIDSFSARGVKQTLDDQTAVSEAAMMTDAYGALVTLGARADIDGSRIALFGISKGGSAALFGALERYRARLAPDGKRFAAHVALYPWCGVEHLRPLATGAPILILGGEDDTVTPATLCRALIARWRDANPQLDARHVVYPGTRHAFDHPLLDLPLAAHFGKPGLTPMHCAIREVGENEFVETHTGRMLTAESVREVIEACSAEGATIGKNADSAKRALGEIHTFLAEVLAAPVRTSD